MFIKPLLGIVAAVAAAPWAFGAISASTTISTTSTSAPFNYTMSVTNTGTTPIGTLWFAWTNVPITYNLLPAPASNISWPSGWVGFPTGPDRALDGYGVEYYTFNPIGPGQTLTGFNFTSNVAPAHLGDSSGSYPLPIDTTYVFQSYLNTGPGVGALATPAVVVPEPVGVVVGIVCAVMLGGRNARRKRVHDTLGRP
jgi:hypothetical protein